MGDLNIPNWGLRANDVCGVLLGQISTKQKNWLGGLDSNQDSQIQSLESYQLDDLPAGRNKNEPGHVPEDRDSHDSPF
jgi:hypothetical protein